MSWLAGLLIGAIAAVGFRVVVSRAVAVITDNVEALDLPS